MKIIKLKMLVYYNKIRLLYFSLCKSTNALLAFPIVKRYQRKHMIFLEGIKFFIISSQKPEGDWRLRVLGGPNTLREMGFFFLKRGIVTQILNTVSNSMDLLCSMSLASSNLPTVKE